MTSNPTTHPTDSSAYSPLTVFAVLWATATFLHLMSFHFWARTWQGWVLVLCTSLVLLRPRSPQRFGFLIAASLLNLFRSLPFVPNHILFEGMINLTILTGFLWAAATADRETRMKIFHLGRPRRIAVNVLALCVYLALVISVRQEDFCGFLTVLMMLLFSRPERSPKLPSQLSEDEATRLYRGFVGVLRWELAVMYFWAVIQKLNSDYANPAVSCAVQMQRELEQRLWLPATPEVIEPLFIWGSLALELTIPLLLLVRRTRHVGFVVACIFHIWLSLHPFAGIYSYSALVLAMLVTFLSPQQLRAVQTCWRAQQEWIRERFPIPRDPEFFGGCVITVFYILGITSSLLYANLGEDRSTFEKVNTLGLIAFLGWAGWLCRSYIAAWAINTEDDRQSVRGLRWTPAWIGICLVLFNGLSPWIGLKTQNSFAMFSNLRTEFAPNHLFLQRAPLFGYQNDMVEVVASEPDILAPPEHPTGIEQFANPGRILPFFEVRRLLSRIDGDVTVTIRRPDELVTLWRKGGEVSDESAFTPPSLLEQKLLWFRRHDEWSGPMPCTH
ncbi:HTTM domain-containing protein [Rubinisphaera margarita]|uniref:HTTM domain-containing protein n=1 Tax=Rubinisphaera margarita TaxID=2909586 RepID=UPI001EE7F197|nr:HTTM domain-containing protein [Rubinisphaera margarita]MCG6156498.1 HTTM domain-containing protein [Rubinisphaera margarita]